MEARPSPLAERIVSALLPPSRREEVMGDLQERFQSPRQYALDALSTVPFVVWSQIRRTSSLARRGAQASGMLATLVAVLAVYPPEVIFRPGYLHRILVPVAIAMLTIVLRDAYADVDRGRSEEFADDSLGPVNVLLVEYVLGLIGSASALPLLIVIAWCAASIVLLGMIRVVAPSSHPRRGSTRGSVAAASSLPDMTGEEPADFRQQLERRRDKMRYWSAWHAPGVVAMIVTPLLLWMMSLAFNWGDPTKAVIAIALVAAWIRMFLAGHVWSKRAERALQRKIDSLDARDIH